MHSYVHGRSGPTDRSSQFEPFKQEVPPVEGFNPYGQKLDRGQKQDRDNKNSQPRTVPEPHQVTRDEAKHSRLKSKLADASSMGDTTATPEEAFYNPSNGRLPGNREPHDQPAEENFMDDEDDADLQRIDVPPHTTSHLPKRGGFLGGSLNKRHSTDGSLKTVKGDSYPPTTSGQPSVSDRQEIKEQVYEQTTHHAQQQAHNGHVEHRPKKARSKEALQLQPKTSTPQPKAAAPKEVAEEAAREPEQTQAFEESQHVQRQYTQSAPQFYHFNGFSQDQMDVQAPDDHNPGTEMQKAAHAQNVFQQQAGQQGAVQTNNHHPGMPTPEITQPQRTHHQEKPASHQTHQEPQQQPFTFDYPLPDLHKMSYAEIQSADFDLNSSKRKRDLPKYCQTNDLPKKLEAGLSLDDETQLKLFTTLNMREWEEAGDWFLDKFKETIEKLQQARKKKREELATFEDMVKDRHEDVQRKRKAIEGAVDGMRVGAQSVLDRGTPRKT